MNKVLSHFLKSLIVALNLLFRGLIAAVICLTVYYFNTGIGFVLSVMGGVVFVLYPLLQIKVKGEV